MTQYRSGAFLLRGGKLARFCWPDDHIARIESMRAERLSSAQRAERADWRRRVAWRLYQEGFDNEESAAALDVHPMTIGQYIAVRKWLEQKKREIL